MSKISLKFKVVEHKATNAAYSEGCSGERSECCTRVCTKGNVASAENNLKSWDQYLEVNAGVLQY